MTVDSSDRRSRRRPAPSPGGVRLCASVLIAVFALLTFPPTMTAEPLRVMTFNIRYGSARDGENSWANRRERVFETIRAFDPDVLALQEALAFQLEEIDEAVPGYRRVGVGRDDGRAGGEFAPLLLREERIRVDDWGTVWLSDQPDTPGSITWGGSLPRILTWARVEDRATGRMAYVGSTHWDHESQESREKSADLIASLREEHVPSDMPTLLMGDFNAGPVNPAIRRLLRADTGLVDTFRAANPDQERPPTFNGFRNEARGEQIDWVFASGHWRVQSAGVVETAAGEPHPSDHFPVTAVVTLDAK